MAPHRYGFILKIVKNIESHSVLAVVHSDSSAVYFCVSKQQRGGERKSYDLFMQNAQLCCNEAIRHGELAPK